MRIHYLQHEPFEDLAGLDSLLIHQGHHLTGTRLCYGEPLPRDYSAEALIVMGGSMSVNDERVFPWLIEEKKFIERTIARRLPVLGVCLGAQLIASVLGARVRQNEYREIGWFPVYRTPESDQCPFFSLLPWEFTPFHWHGETFELPHGAIHTAWSDACRNQAFSYNGTVIAVQFHLESTHESVLALAKHCAHEITEDVYVQNRDYLVHASEQKINHTQPLLRKLVFNLLSA